MNPAEVGIIVRGVVDLAAIAAIWSVLFYGRVKVSSPTTSKASSAARKASRPGPGEQPPAADTRSLP